ncbi:hypothetical protein RTCIAT899_PC02765 (plasmid) [Rhizobium tropici CIAT 899]|nr:hypothetical protein RTCIAT899_PC02765 [Rhizobium tropici CIAT 899]TGF01172.1 hypothetical protein C9417_02125 [Rhizobium sp. SEMIA 4088]
MHPAIPMIVLTGQLQYLRRVAVQKCTNAKVVFRLDPARGDSVTLTGSSADPLLRSRENAIITPITPRERNYL